LQIGPSCATSLFLSLSKNFFSPLWGDLGGDFALMGQSSFEKGSERDIVQNDLFS